MIPGSPMLWLIGALTLALPVTYGVTKLNAAREAKASYAEGKQAGLGSASTQTVGAATKTAQAGREAEASVPPVSLDRAKRIEACKRDFACRDRGKF